jgi:ABC-type uncharacterized transport system substrate-binding protein
MHHTSGGSNGYQLTAGIMKEIDLVIISRNSELMSHSKEISENAAQHGVPVLSTDQSRADEVFMSIASNVETTIGTTCAKQALKILEDGIPPNAVDVKHIEHDEIVHLNLKAPSFIGQKKYVAEALLKSTTATIQLK